MRVADTMTEQGVANSLWALATLTLDLGAAREPLMRATVRVADTKNAQEVANSMWAFATLGLELGVARDPLLQQVPRIAAMLEAKHAQQVRTGLDWIQGQGEESSELRRAWKAIAKKKCRLARCSNATMPQPIRLTE